MPNPPRRGANFSGDREFTVILEDLRSQFNVFGEGLNLLNDKMDRFEHRMERFENRLERVDLDVEILKITVTATRKEVGEIRGSMDRFFSTLSDHETRITRIETKV